LFSKKASFTNFFNPFNESFSFNLINKIGIALVATLWAYQGWESTTYSIGEMKYPERNLPLGLIIGTFIIILLYLLANIAYLSILPIEAIAKSERVASDAMNAAIGPIGSSIIAIIILISIAGAANGNSITGPRVYYAMAKDDLFFKSLAEIHPKFLTPHVSIVAIAIWSSILTISGTFEELFTYVIFGQWVFFILSGYAVIRLRKIKPELKRPYKTWGYPYTPLIFMLSAFLICLNALIYEFYNSIKGLIIIALGIPFYLKITSKMRS